MEKTKRAKQFCGSKTYSPQKLIAAGDTLIPHSSFLIPQSKKFSLTSKEKYAIIKENGMTVKFYDGSNFDENNGYYRLC
ncbi:hypothetical protein [Ruminococcus sp.]|uniref:hypothetical protein n=1 Tax=Ruminococcus sp. TaxID=41978 RepID=UPI003AF1D38F